METKIIEYKGTELEVRSEKKDWRQLFSQEQLSKGYERYSEGRVTGFITNGFACEAKVQIANNVYQITVQGPARFDEHWSHMPFTCTCQKSIKSRYPSFGGRRHSWYGYSYHEDNPALWAKCDHMVPVMYFWEEQHGPWIIEETAEELDEKYQRIEKERQRRIEQEDWARDSRKAVSVASLLDWRIDQTCWFDLQTALKGARTNVYFANRFHSTEEKGKIRQTLLANGDHQLLYSGSFSDCEADGARGECKVSLALEKDRLTKSECTGFRCKGRAELCQHQLTAWNQVLNELRACPIADQTDKDAKKLFAFFEDKTEDTTDLTVSRKEREQPKSEAVVLEPRLMLEGESLLLGYRIGRRSGRMYVLKAPQALLAAKNNEKIFPLGKNDALDFSQEIFMDSCRKDVEQLSLIAGRKNFSDREFAYEGNLLALEGERLDTLYDNHEGQSLELEERAFTGKRSVRLAHGPVSVEMKSEPIRDIGGRFLGIWIRGSLAPVFRGKTGTYMLHGGYLLRMTPAEAVTVKPFCSISEDGQFDFRIGWEGIPDFYRRVLPSALAIPGINYTDLCREEIDRVLPPEPSFRFFLSIENQILQCRVTVVYDGEEKPLSAEKAESAHLRDITAEKHVNSVLGAVFQEWDDGRQVYMRSMEDESTFLFLHEGLPRLEALGEVFVTQAVKNLRMERVPQVTVQISLESGLLNLEVHSAGLSREELLELLDSYEKKKTYHRLRSGVFIDLTEDELLYEFDSLLRQTRLVPGDVLKERISLPMYRTLYLNRMLEEREAIRVSRDRMYRSLLKNFATIRDADWEVPSVLADTLRPYQQYGFKWLKTLNAAGFGGILADEMGLGKTIQAISLLQSEKESGVSLLALIVCPASLQYYWQEEIHRFAPELRVTVLSNGVSQRYALLKQLTEMQGNGSEVSDAPEVLVCSYDLLRRDITRYDRIRFTTCILDEAQYIKNQNSAISKAVRLLHAEHRFALTGTPIENRLSELWSIFSFLMPGFLYSSEEFRENFEEPIMRRNDATAVQTLRQMTSPFILRRLKADVLKELPPKLEEVRYLTFDSDQRRIYDAQMVKMREMLEKGFRPSDKLQIFAGLMRLRQICCDPSLYLEGYTGTSAKREGCLELIRSAMDGGHRMLVFSQFTSMLELLEADLREAKIPCLKITGATPKERRLGLIRDFNEGDTPVFLVSLKAGGTGLNLTGADIVIHYDPWWNLAAQNQATDRVHRIGQTRQVTVYRLIAQGTIEERILALQNTKQDLADSILSGDHTSLMSLSADELLALLG